MIMSTSSETVTDISGKEKHYIYHMPSARGMGSDTDTALVSETNLHEIFTEEEIRKGLTECTTYERVSDLIEIPREIPILVDTLHFEDVIFRVFNQWGYERDIIVGDAMFHRYHIELSPDPVYFGRAFKKKACYEFMNFDFKHVCENHFFLFYKAKDLMKGERDRVRRLEGDEYSIDLVSCARANIAKFEHLPELKDEYYEHFYHQHYADGRKHMRDSVERGIKEDDVDHTQCAYDYPLLPETFACEIRRDDDPADRLRYDELFRKGTDVRHLVADLIGNEEWLDGFKYPQIDLALLTVFGYD